MSGAHYCNLARPAPSKRLHLMSTRNVHVWKSLSEDGEKREVRAEKFAGRWRFQARCRGEEAWTYYDSPPLEDLIELRDVLWRKYQRKRLPFEDVTAVDQMIRERGGQIGEPRTESEPDEDGE